MTRKKTIALLLAGLLLAPVPFGASSAHAAEESVPEAKGALSPSPLTDRFWLERNGATGDILLASAEEIAALNDAIRERDPLSTDVAHYPAARPAEEIRTYIAAEAEDALTADLWTAGRPVSDRERDMLRQALTIGAAGGTVATRRAVTLRRANLRELPTEAAWYEGDDSFEDDWLQGTAIDPGEPVILLGTNRDGWHFVQMRNYRGWLPPDAIALADDATWELFARPARFLVVTASRVAIPLPALPAAIAEKRATGVPRRPQSPDKGTAPAPMEPPLLFQMGSRVPLHRDTADGWEVILPAAQGGRLVPRMVTMPKDEVHFHEGVLPYTVNTLIRQAFRFLGAPYDWGGHDGSVDCSALTSDIYRTVGIELPRDADMQEAVMSPQWKFEEKSGAERCAILETVPPGSLLFLPGHVMMYLGMDDSGTPLVLHAMSLRFSFSPDGRRLSEEPVRRVVVSGLALPRASGRTYFEELTAAAAMLES
ncbi:MAG: NlpC/P60 family protein [Schwartzia sp. (in: firmicutes)]